MITTLLYNNFWHKSPQEARELESRDERETRKMRARARFGWKTAGDACEREVDSTDPLRPTSNELSGARLLLRRAAKDSPVEELSVPGLVPRHSTTSPVRVTHGSSRTPSQTRMGTATSQHTFVIETERRRPLFHPIGLSEYAIEYKKVTDSAEKARREEELRIMKEKEKEEREKERIRSRQTTGRKPPAWKYEKWRCETTQRNFRKSNSKDHGPTRAVESAPMGVRKKAPLRATSLNRSKK
ncbi:hypothetical protein WR25_12380 isoform D [Diploscapter pachys]|uniref:Uncharacterized protein n=1 Tax=Diploscapter pachys TaxID=2018661 RepID=A0A2A2J9W5_9BILA|nr:hypothetical protein WR25_12380 isoform D [Diploscapter pachys]